MKLTIDISPELEVRLKEVALRLGVGEAEYARKLIETNLKPSVPVRDQATLDLLAKWDAEDRALTPEEIALAEKEWEEFKKGMNEHCGRLIYP